MKRNIPETRHLVDVRDSRIEYNVGDKWDRTPHFVVEVGAGPSGVLYVPSRRGSWNAKAFESVDLAAVWLDQIGHQGVA